MSTTADLVNALKKELKAAQMTYKGQGRLIFAGGGMGDFSSGNLIWIIHNRNEPGYR